MMLTWVYETVQVMCMKLKCVSHACMYSRTGCGWTSKSFSCDPFCLSGHMTGRTTSRSLVGPWPHPHSTWRPISDIRLLITSHCDSPKAVTFTIIIQCTCTIVLTLLFLKNHMVNNAVSKGLIRFYYSYKRVINKGTYQWYHPSHGPSHPIMGDPSSGLLHWGQNHTCPPVLTATGKIPPPSVWGVVCCRDDLSDNNGNSIFGIFINGMLEAPFFDAFPDLQKVTCTSSSLKWGQFTYPLGLPTRPPREWDVVVAMGTARAEPLFRDFFSTFCTAGAVGRPTADSHTL